MDYNNKKNKKIVELHRKYIHQNDKNKHLYAVSSCRWEWFLSFDSVSMNVLANFSLL